MRTFRPTGPGWRQFVGSVLCGVLTAAVLATAILTSATVHAQNDASDVSQPSRIASAKGARFTFTRDWHALHRINPAMEGGVGASGPSPSANLAYHGGPVMTTYTAYVIYWFPQPYVIPAGYQELIDRWFGDVGGTDLYDILTQYFEITGQSVSYIPNAATFGGSWIDTVNPYPRVGTAAGPLILEDFEVEVQRAIAANAWPHGTSDVEFFVYTAPGIENCAFGHCTPGVPNGDFCAYHYFLGCILGAGCEIGAVMPYAGTPLWNSACLPDSSPNANLDADAEISLTSHEQFESITDPTISAWYDTDNTGEIADKCAWTFGPVAPDGSNVSLNGHPYYVQQEWSNAAFDGTNSGCVLSGSIISHVCGNGIVESVEQCDDGNNLGGDGCSPTCTVESGWSCSGQPSICVRYTPTPLPTPTPTAPPGLVPGIAADACMVEWLTNPTAPKGNNGLPVRRLTCTDDDPTCDFGAAGGDRSCTFQVALCLNVADTRVPCLRTDFARLKILSPSETQPRSALAMANRNALEGVMTSVGAAVKGTCVNRGPRRGQLCTTDAECDAAPGVGNGICRGRFVAFEPPLTAANVCTPYALITVPLRQTAGGLRRSATRLVVAAASDRTEGARGGDALTLICRPHQ